MPVQRPSDLEAEDVFGGELFDAEEPKSVLRPFQDLGGGIQTFFGLGSGIERYRFTVLGPIVIPGLNSPLGPVFGVNRIGSILAEDIRDLLILD